MTYQLHHGDCRNMDAIPNESVNCCVTSPPYFGLRDYGHDGQIGLEQTPDEYVEQIVAVFREVWRVLRDDGTVWLNLGDSYANDGKWGGSSGGKHVAALHGNSGIGRSKVTTGLKPKDLIGIPWRVAFALQADGWWLRQDIIWSKPNPMPESVTDRCTKAHEYIFLLTKSARYWYDADAVKEPSVGTEYDKTMRAKNRMQGAPHLVVGRNQLTAGASLGVGTENRNRRSVWHVATQPFAEAHFATYPPALIEPCVLAGCPKGGTVLDPFTGSGTTGLVAVQNRRNFVGYELNAEYHAMATRRISEAANLLDVAAPLAAQPAPLEGLFAE